MKFATKIGFAAAAVALIAMLGAASASASALTETILCKEVKQAPYCKKSERYPKGTAISASPGFPAETVSIESAIINVTCTESTISGATSAEAGEPLPLSVSAWTLGGCVRVSNGKPCTVTALERAPYSGSLNRTSGSDGTMAIGSGGKGKPGWNVHCGVTINCTMAIEPGFSYSGQPGHAKATVEKLPLERISGVCPEALWFSATYIVNSPVPARLAIPKEAPTNPATALCKSADNYCEPGDLYKSGTVLKAPITEPVLVTSGEYAYGDFSCSSGVLQVETTADYGEHLPVTVALDSLSSCHSEGLGSCTISSLGPGSSNITRQLDGENLLTGDGTWSQYFGVPLYIQCGSHECVIGLEPGEATLIHGEPAKIEGIFNWGGPQGSSYCPEYMKLEFGGLTLSSPSSLVVTDALR